MDRKKNNKRVHTHVYKKSFKIVLIFIKYLLTTLDIYSKIYIISG